MGTTEQLRRMARSIFAKCHTGVQQGVSIVVYHMEDVVMRSQKIGKCFGGLVIVGVLVALNACAVDRVVRERGLRDGIMLDANGKWVVIDLKSGQVIPSCQELEKTDRKCKYHFGKDMTPEGITIKNEARIRIISYVGSDCDTYVDLVTGEEHEACRPPLDN